MIFKHVFSCDGVNYLIFLIFLIWCFRIAGIGVAGVFFLKLSHMHQLLDVFLIKFYHFGLWLLDDRHLSLLWLALFFEEICDRDHTGTIRGNAVKVAWVKHLVLEL